MSDKPKETGQQLEQAKQQLKQANQMVAETRDRIRTLERAAKWARLASIMPALTLFGSAGIWMLFREWASQPSWLDLVAFGGVLLTEVLVVAFICLVSTRYLARYD